MDHTLKTINPYFNEVWCGTKKFELRKNDRKYEVGQKIMLLEYDPETDYYSGRNITAIIEYILENATEFGLMEDYCILGLDVYLHNKY